MTINQTLTNKNEETRFKLRPLKEAVYTLSFPTGRHLFCNNHTYPLYVSASLDLIVHASETLDVNVIPKHICHNKHYHFSNNHSLGDALAGK